MEERELPEVDILQVINEPHQGKDATSHVCPTHKQQLLFWSQNASQVIRCRVALHVTWVGVEHLVYLQGVAHLGARVASFSVAGL